MCCLFRASRTKFEFELVEQALSFILSSSFPAFSLQSLSIFIPRSCGSVAQNKAIGCEELSAAAQRDKKAVKCTCDTDKCNNERPERNVDQETHINTPRDVTYRPPTQSQSITPTPSSNSLKNINNNDSSPTKIQLDMRLRTHSTVKPVERTLGDSYKTKKKLKNIQAVQGNGSNCTLPCFFLVYYSAAVLAVLHILL